jgi:hypothetical protein
MNTIPEWVTTAVGIYALLGSVFMLLLVIVAVLLVRVLLDLRREIRRLSDRVDSIGNRVDTIAAQVEHVTSEVGMRASALSRMVDEAAGGAISAVEKFGPVLLVAGGLLRIWFGARRSAQAQKGPALPKRRVH